MSARQSPSVDATAFRLAALLEQYEEDIEDLTSPWLDCAAYARVTRCMGEMRPLCAGLPLLSVASLQLLITHFELLHCLWNAAGPDAADTRARKADHLGAVRTLRSLCLCQSPVSRVAAETARSPAAYFTRR